MSRNSLGEKKLTSILVHESFPLLKQCGEHRDSGILKRGFLAPKHVPDKIDATVSKRNSPGQGSTLEIF